MPARYTTVEEYKQENLRNIEDFSSPHNGALFYTNGAKDDALKHATEFSRNSHPCVTLEGNENGEHGTIQGVLLQRDSLFDNLNASTLRLNEKEVEKKAGETDEYAGANKVWDHASELYARHATGSVEVFCDEKPPRNNSVFVRCERNALINNEKVTQINGVSRTELKQILVRVENGKLDAKIADNKINSLIVEGDKNRSHRMKLEIEQEKQAQGSPWGQRSQAAAKLEYPDKSQEK